MRRIAILGAGISGLATAWYLKRLDPSFQVIIIEKSSRPGGWIQTSQLDGFLFEQGPKSFRTKGGVETLWLIEALGLGDEVIVPSTAANNRYVFNGKHLQKLPKSFLQVPFNSLTNTWLKALWRDWRMPRAEFEDESISSFFSRRLGIAFVEQLIDPFVRGIYAGDCRRLSLKSCFPLFDEWEKKYGSLLKGAWYHRPIQAKKSPLIEKISLSPLFSFQNGMEVLPLALARELKKELFLNQTAKSLIQEGKDIAIELTDKSILRFDCVISTLPAFALASLLNNKPSFSQVSEKMASLPFASLAIVNVGFKSQVKPLKGFGYLVPSQFKKPELGCVWDSSVFPEQNDKNQTRLTFMLGGTQHPDIVNTSDSDLKELTLQLLKDRLDILEKPTTFMIKRAQQAIPQFEVGYMQWKNEIEKEVKSLFPHLVLSGSSWGGVSINDCIRNAKALAESMIQ